MVKRILHRTRNEFNVSAAEVGENDALGQAELAFVAVGNDRRFINSVLDKVLNHVDGLQLAEVGDHDIEIMNV
ncbi:MAG: DUF503 domain-containing protein [Deltaproteobacteria bacterium]|nr:DUF503 domain-containing protein [Deltaproteobacteria bacterium]